MEITPEQARHVAKLARLDLSDEEITNLAADMGEVLTYVGKLAELDTETVQPTASIVDTKNPFRKDEVTNKPDPEKAVANAPRHEATFFVVPNIIE
jgi:aspartyl-tRNA(Asn)/glutamyl-tRNA(Gln) amidotransferase subunit C